MPRWISEIAPSVSAGKSSGSQPEFDVSAAALGITMSLVGTTGASTSPELENANVMKSTAGSSSSACVPATYETSFGLVCSRIGVEFSSHVGKSNGLRRTR